MFSGIPNSNFIEELSNKEEKTERGSNLKQLYVLCGIR